MRFIVRRNRWVTLSLLSFVLAGCGSSDPSEDPELVLNWQPCAFYTGDSDQQAQCATVSVPLTWSDPAHGTIHLFVKRLGSAHPDRSVWFVAGGPGEASDHYEVLAEDLLERDPATAVYLLDHRGTGRSTRLGCAEQEAESSPGGQRVTSDEWPACIDALKSEWSEDLAHFSSREAATDLGKLIAATNQGEPVHLHGVSYGTYLVNRYLQQFPSQPTSVSMLGVTPPDFSLTEYDGNFDSVGSAFLDRCAADALCSSKLGNDPKSAMLEAFGNMPCPAAVSAGLTRNNLRQFSSVVLLSTWYERVLPLAVAYRILRCNSGDQQALAQFAQNVILPLGEGPPLLGSLYSVVLGRHISLSELWASPGPTVESAQALFDNSLWASGSTLQRTQLYPLWPTYGTEPDADLAASYGGPILFLNGELDPATPAPGAQATAQRFPGHVYIEIPGGTHSFTSPMADGKNCALERYAAFVLHPEQALPDCSDVLPLDFAGSADLATAAFGTTDIWE